MSVLLGNENDIKLDEAWHENNSDLPFPLKFTFTKITEMH